VLGKRIMPKKRIFEFYKRELEMLDGVKMMPVNEWNVPNYWLSCIKLTESVNPLEIMLALEEENIEACQL